MTNPSSSSDVLERHRVSVRSVNHGALSDLIVELRSLHFSGRVSLQGPVRGELRFTDGRIALVDLSENGSQLGSGEAALETAADKAAGWCRIVRS